LFWKKNKIDVELPNNGADHRDAFRIRPGSNRPVLLKVADTSAYLLNISGTGCAFRSSSFELDATAVGTLTIASDDLVFPLSIRVISKKGDLCHCEYTKISSLAREAIHAYVLDMQKQRIRNH